MYLKTKITLGFVAMLLLLLAIGGYAFYTVRQLDRSARAVLQANFHSVEYGQRMLRALDALERNPWTDTAATAQFEQALIDETANVTEPGEQRVVERLGEVFGQLRQYQADRVRAAAPPGSAGAPPTANPKLTAELRALTHRMIELNVQALTAKNSASNRGAERASHYLLAAAALAVLLGLGLVLSVPEAAVQPLRQLTAAIGHASQGHYRSSIPVESRDEFGVVASAFNQLLTQLRDFRASTTAELITERNRMTSLVDSLDEGLLLIDQHGRILLANPTAAELLGLPAAQLVGQPAAELARQNDLLRAMLAPLSAPRRQQAVAELPLFTIAQQGEEAYYRLTVHDIVSFNEAVDEMQFVGYILALRNVSEFKRLDQVKSDFLATVSHELKTPLASLNLSLKLLQDERTAPDKRQGLMQSMRQQTQRLQRMVGELLDVSRLEAGAGIQLDVRPTDLRDVVRYATDTVRAQLHDKHLQLRVELPADLPPVAADVEKTTWVLINLLANAIRYSPLDAPLTVRARPLPDSIELSVQDQGPGIAPAYHERIFQRFAQVPNHTEYRGGSGLGLSIAREFITAQGGRLWVESELGSGSRFAFTLPLAPGHAQ
ncbi:HAMP domain-containing sensor histidine kinase [Hymenobacter gummosus]|uniref:histidine kinase n=1 Tax=Hymenobacter gummosus TaxID=1776032 RepID=A0A3S0K783_9BACT|nr:ATP-binding protein [Hymenobacter gummosus]RTQ51715.1 HAMP domain-containing sensor histidine kinase [Hymenobacter gummosus]